MPLSAEDATLRVRLDASVIKEEQQRLAAVLTGPAIGGLVIYNLYQGGLSRRLLFAEYTNDPQHLIAEPNLEAENIIERAETFDYK